jgi:hypothetical protein
MTVWQAPDIPLQQEKRCLRITRWANVPRLRLVPEYLLKTLAELLLPDEMPVLH